MNHDGVVTGAEALLRWEYPLVGNLYLPLVIALASETGMSEMLGGYLLDQACHDLSNLN